MLFTVPLLWMRRGSWYQLSTMGHTCTIRAIARSLETRPLVAWAWVIWRWWACVGCGVAGTFCQVNHPSCICDSPMRFPPGRCPCRNSGPLWFWCHSWQSWMDLCKPVSTRLNIASGAVKCFWFHEFLASKPNSSLNHAAPSKALVFAAWDTSSSVVMVLVTGSHVHSYVLASIFALQP